MPAGKFESGSGSGSGCDCRKLDHGAAIDAGRKHGRPSDSRSDLGLRGRRRSVAGQRRSDRCQNRARRFWLREWPRAEPGRRRTTATGTGGAVFGCASDIGPNRVGGAATTTGIGLAVFGCASGVGPNRVGGGTNFAERERSLILATSTPALPARPTACRDDATLLHSIARLCNLLAEPVSIPESLGATGRDRAAPRQTAFLNVQTNAGGTLRRTRATRRACSRCSCGGRGAAKP